MHWFYSNFQIVILFQFFHQELTIKLTSKGNYKKILWLVWKRPKLKRGNVFWTILWKCVKFKLTLTKVRELQKQIFLFSFPQKKTERIYLLTSTLRVKSKSKGPLIQMHLCQKYLFSHQLTHNMTKDLPVQYMKTTSSEHVVYMNCSECQNKKTICIHYIFWAFPGFHVLNW